MKRKAKKIMNKVTRKLVKDYKDVNMGISDIYFEELVEFIVNKCEEESE